MALVKRLDALVAELGLEDEVVTWRLRLAAMTRNMTHDELYVWLDRLKLKRADSQVGHGRRWWWGRCSASRLAKPEMSDWDIYRALRSIPLEALVFALAGIEPGVVETRLRRYLADIRHRTLSVKGDDLLALGMKKGPAVGRILERLKELRVEGIVNGRDGRTGGGAAHGGEERMNIDWLTLLVL